MKSSHLGLQIDPRSGPLVSNEVQRTAVILHLYREGKIYSRIPRNQITTKSWYMLYEKIKYNEIVLKR